MKKTITIIVIIGAIVTLATLGTWQVQRLTWKKEIIENITGIFRKPEWNKFTSNNRADLNIWTKPDIKEIAEYLNINDVAPVMLYATQIENNGNLILQDAKWYPRNKHIQYAIFWYGMIFVLMILIVASMRQNKAFYCFFL